MSDLTAIERLLIEHAITRRIHLYARLNDAGDYQALAALYTEAGRFARPTDPDNFVEGRDAILASFLARPARLGRHVMANIVVDVENATTARAISTILLFLGGDGADPVPIAATLVGEFADRLEKIGGDWLFAERRGTVAMKG